MFQSLFGETLFSLANTLQNHFFAQILYAADLFVMEFFTSNWMDALSIQCLWHKVKRVLCVSQWLFSCQWPMMPDPSLSLSPLALYSVFSHLRGNQRCMLLCWCLSTAKVSPMCLIDLPVRFCVRFSVPQQSWAAGLCHCLSLGVSESRQGGDEIGLIMVALFLC